MKIKVFFKFSTALVALLFCCSINQIQAQDGAMTTGKQVKICDAILPAIQKQLQADADATCTTQTTCVEWSASGRSRK